MNNFEILGRHIGEIDGLIERWIKKQNFSYNNFAVLYTLATSSDGQCTQKQIAEEWYLPKQTVFNICKDYKEKGWIEYSESSTDKRERIMRLTAAGKACAEPLAQATTSMIDAAFGAFGKKKTAQLFRLMTEFCQVCGEKIDEFEATKRQ